MAYHKEQWEQFRPLDLYLTRAICILVRVAMEYVLRITIFQIQLLLLQQNLHQAAPIQNAIELKYKEGYENNSTLG